MSLKLYSQRTGFLYGMVIPLEMTAYSGNNTGDLHIPEMWVSGKIAAGALRRGGSVIPPNGD